MKQLFLVRHAKASWEFEGLDDFDRPLHKSGKKDAPEMAKRVKEKNVSIDVIVSSPAKRAFTTAAYFADEFDIKKKKIIQKDYLYEPTTQAFYKAIEELNDEDNSVAIFSHNPTITAFANELTNVHVDDMPTCSMFAIRVLTDAWKNFKTAEKEFWFFDYPKNV